jgi:hypothetical protein
MLVGVNVNDTWLNEATSVLRCKIGKIPFVYLELSTGGNPRCALFWEPVLNRIKSKLSGWRSHNLSLYDRLILLKPVLSSLPIYAHSFFKTPLGIIFFIDSILNCFFFWGEDNRKIFWVNWESICMRKEEGNLGVTRG